MVNYMKNKYIYLGTIIAILTVIIFFSVWLSAYSGVSNRVNNLEIAIVNKDSNVSKATIDEIKSSIPFKVKEYKTTDDTLKKLNARNIAMVIEIPKTFMNDIQSNQSSQIKFYINQAQSSVSKNLMETTSIKVTDAMNEKIFIQKKDIIMNQIDANIKTQLPSKEMSQAMSQAIKGVFETLNVKSIHLKTEKTHEIEEFSASMLPLLVTIASFVSAMLMMLLINMGNNSQKYQKTKWELLFNNLFINILVSAIMGIAMIGFIRLFNITIAESLGSTWLFLSMAYWSLISLCQLVFSLFGIASPVINMLLLSTQIVTSGSIIPTILLPNYWNSISRFLPAKYIVEGIYASVFGSGDLIQNIMILLFFVGISVLLLCLVTFAKKDNLLEVNN